MGPKKEDIILKAGKSNNLDTNVMEILEIFRTDLKTISTDTNDDLHQLSSILQSTGYFSAKINQISEELKALKFKSVTDLYMLQVFIVHAVFKARELKSNTYAKSDYKKVNSIYNMWKVYVALCNGTYVIQHPDTFPHVSSESKRSAQQTQTYLTRLFSAKHKNFQMLQQNEIEEEIFDTFLKENYKSIRREKNIKDLYGFCLKTGELVSVAGVDAQADFPVRILAVKTSYRLMGIGLTVYAMIYFELFRVPFPVPQDYTTYFSSEGKLLYENFFNTYKKLMSMSIPANAVSTSMSDPLAENAAAFCLNQKQLAQWQRLQAPLDFQARQKVLGKLEEVVGENDDVVANAFKVGLKQGDFLTLREGGWVNDEVINFYIQLLKERDTALCSKLDFRRPSHYFTSLFISKLLNLGPKGSGIYEYPGVRAWTKKVDVFAMDMLFIPINIENSHWTLVVVNVQKCEIHYYDSLNRSEDKYLEAVQRWLHDEAKDKDKSYNAALWKHYSRESSVPQQQNGFDCGVFLCVCAEYLTEGLPLQCYSQSDMGHYRLKIGYAILVKGENISLNKRSREDSISLPSKRSTADNGLKTVQSPLANFTVEELKLMGCVNNTPYPIFVVSKIIQEVYSIQRKFLGELGGGSANGPIYGEITLGSMQRVMGLLVESCGWNSSSLIVDVGSGLGKPNYHAANFDIRARLSIGVEIVADRWIMSMSTLREIGLVALKPGLLDTNQAPSITGVNFIQGDISAARTLDPFTHIYQFDLGFEPALQESIAEKFNNSRSAQYLVSYRSPREIAAYGYQAELVQQCPTSLCGSGEGHAAYFYRRTNQPPAATPRENLVLPARASTRGCPGLSETSVYCDPFFLDSARLAVGDSEALLKHATGVVLGFWNQSRPRRGNLN